MGQERQSAKVRGKVAMINEAMLETLDGRYERATEIRLEMPLHVSVVTAGLIRAGVSQKHVESVSTRIKETGVLACGACP